MDLITGGLYQGQENYIKENYKNSFEMLPFVIEELKKGKSESEIKNSLLKLADEYEAVNAPEIGAGMIPIDSFERNLREVYGRSVCLLSDKAKSVIRMVCGIKVIIK